MSITGYENNVTATAQMQLEDLVARVSPEYILEILSDLYEKRPGYYDKIASCWLYVGANAICEELPSNLTQKDFPDEGKTIGQMVKYLMEKYPSRDLVETVDYVINKKVVEDLLRRMHTK